MRIIFLFLLLLSEYMLAQEDDKPQYYNPAFKMPENNSVRTDSFYLVKIVKNDTVRLNTRKEEYFYQSYERKIVYQFFPDGSYFHREYVDKGYHKIVDNLKTDKKWVGNMSDLPGISCWGFYKIENEKIFMESFNIQYANLLKASNVIHIIVLQMSII